MTGQALTSPPSAGVTAAGCALPVKFAVADELTCYYDRLAEPANVHLEARVPGRLDESAIRAAVQSVLAAEPGLRVRRMATSGWRRRYYWESPPVADVDPVSVAAYADESELDGLRSALLSEPAPLRAAPPFRFLLASGPAGDVLILNAHHARFDGLSCLRLLNLVASEYRARAGLSDLPGPVAAPAALTPLAAPDTTAPGRRARGGWAGRVRASLGVVTRIARQPEPGPASARLGYGVHVLTWDGLAAATEFRSRGYSVNDLLIAALVGTIEEWNASHGARSGLIRITMPVGDKSQAEAGGQWANRSRLTTVTQPGRGAGLGPSEAGLLDEIAAQTRQAKDQAGAQVGLVSRAVVAAPVPVAVKHRLLRTALRIAGPYACDSCLISNLGVIESPAFGGASGTRLWFSTSAHMPRGLSLGAVTCDGVLRLTFRYRRALFCDAAGARFARRYVEALDQLTRSRAAS